MKQHYFPSSPHHTIKYSPSRDVHYITPNNSSSRNRSRFNQVFLNHSHPGYLYDKDSVRFLPAVVKPGYPELKIMPETHKHLDILYGLPSFEEGKLGGTKKHIEKRRYGIQRRKHHSKCKSHRKRTSKTRLFS